ncbi:hypothetical protein Prum_102660 [Phytohabitans rumicis]|uniref:Dyp-type peroxidase C-terminal domain-containing protein n=1 Tax=Phytohabitans rumicis TaxID=1076125 RepID=A0A6V8LK87_9ACTN|nr:hypothetical protein Prum_102660 [Phytohabitans rumicis]
MYPCFELAGQIMDRLRGAATARDEVHGFKYFDMRDLLGFVDGTENPVGSTAERAVLVGDEDPAFAGGSYVIVQKYLHDLRAWNALPVEAQERIVGRTKLTNIELDDAVKPANSHVALTVITEPDGTERKILRDNMPFGTVGRGEFGTYFIGYARTPAVTETMLENMFLGDPPGNTDRILEFSTAVTGTLFFAPRWTSWTGCSLPTCSPPACTPSRPTWSPRGWTPCCAASGSGAWTRSRSPSRTTGPAT